MLMDMRDALPETGQNEVGEVEFLYIANMHGDEVVGRQLSIYFIYHLCSNYDTNPTIKALIDNTDIHILPTMNPDGMTRRLLPDEELCG